LTKKISVQVGRRFFDIEIEPTTTVRQVFELLQGEGLDISDLNIWILSRADDSEVFHQDQTFFTKVETGEKLLGVKKMEVA
jgi:hypothetical protein